MSINKHLSAGSNTDDVGHAHSEQSERILDWEDRVDCLGPHAALADLKEALADAPEGAPSFPLLRDIVNIRSRIEEPRK